MKIPSFFLIIGLFLNLLATAESKPANILFILVDDLGYADLGCQGSQEIRTPNIDLLAEQGVRFTDAYVTSPQCGPSRAGIVTGVNPARFGYLSNGRHQGLPDPDVLPLISEVIRSAGYRTGFVGKWHIGQGTEYLIKRPEKHAMALLPPERIDRAKPWLRGFDQGMFVLGGSCYFFPFKAPFSGHPRSHFYTFNGPENEPKEIFLDEESYVTDFFTDYALEFLEKSDGDEPFFLFLSYTAPHAPLQAKPEDIAANSHIEDEKRQIFAAMMTSLDKNIGRILSLLGDKGLLDSTLVVFLSDNGGQGDKKNGNTSRNDPFTGAKGYIQEGGIRVPCIFTWPDGLPKGRVYSQPVSSLDLFTTFAAVAGAKLKPDLDYDGTNLIPYLEAGSANDSPPHEHLFWIWHEKKALRSGDYKWLDTRGTGCRIKPQYGVFNLAENDKENSRTVLNAPERLRIMEQRYKEYWEDRFGEFTPEN